MNRLVRLEVESLAIIDRLALELGGGLCAFTGETGAGKSIVIDALGLLLGGRGSSEMIRSGRESLLVSGFWDDELVAGRRITAAGRGTARLEGEVVSVRELGARVGERLTLHGQHAAVALLSTRTHREFLDKGLPAGDLLERYSAAYTQFTTAKDRLERLKMGERERARELDLLEYQFREIADLNPQGGEEEPLEAELERLSNLEEIAAQAAQSLELLQEADYNALSLIQEAVKTLSNVAKVDPAVATLRETLKEVASNLKAVSSELTGISEDSAPDPEELERISNRLTGLTKLKNKYGATLKDVLNYQSELEVRLLELRGDDADLGDLETHLTHFRSLVLEVGAELSKARAEVALELGGSLVSVVRKLGMPHARLEFALTALPEPSSNGLESVEILFSANPGEDLGPLSSVVSGGELSRVMLSLSTVLGSSTPTVIFDEVDAGIGGSAAGAVAGQLADLALSHQVLVVTHLAQIAARADHHYLVEKRVRDDGRTETTVRALNESERLEELARMLSGEVSKVALEHARELLFSAGQSGVGRSGAGQSGVGQSGVGQKGKAERKPVSARG